MSIDELEKLLSMEDQEELEILPNGTVRRLGVKARDASEPKPLTMKEQLGGEYAR